MHADSPFRVIVVLAFGYGDTWCGQGSEADVSPYLLAHYFGREHPFVLHSLLEQHMLPALPKGLLYGHAGAC